MLCKFKNGKCKDNLIEAVVKHWNKYYGDIKTISVDIYKDNKTPFDFVPFELAIDESLHICQPERSKREDSQQCEMRCSEHCGNTVRDK